MNTGYHEYVRRSYRLMAPVYDFFMRPLSGTRKQVVGLTASCAGQRVLDVATGTGEQAFAFADAGFETIGIDLSADMIRRARKKKGRPNMLFLVEDASQMSFDDDVFDMAVISMALHEMAPDILDGSLGEIKRVVRNSGTIVAVDYDLSGVSLAKRLTNSLFKLVESNRYTDFPRFDLESVLAKSDIEKEAAVPALMGRLKIVRGKNRK